MAGKHERGRPDFQEIIDAVSPLSGPHHGRRQHSRLHCLLDRQCLTRGVSQERLFVVSQRKPCWLPFPTTRHETFVRHNWGSEAIHSIRQSNDEGGCRPTMDLENAFNQIDRFCFLREVQRAALGLTRYCDVCCSHDRFLCSDFREFRVKEGVQQGGACSLTSIRVRLQQDGRFDSTNASLFWAPPSVP